MFKNRSYVVGIGTGIIVGALLLQLMSVRVSAPAPTSVAIDDLDPQKLKERTSKYYQVFDKDTVVYTQAELDKKVKEETDKRLAVKPQEQPKVKEAEASSKTIVYVQPNLDATAVSELLFKAGVISDRKAFATELEKQGGNYKIQVGFHVFEGPQDIQKVVLNLITAQQ
ncbi:endolytic transglycosylase MltG [Paenibacillus sp. N3.4]|uniref:endolytic transglycosylase MltG n=1 Tax=Paenibacillus sp. N3.4 TaxID=2603222 RepID=UPI0011C7B422|nr:endolytic transglycosylase MltG [Paenibacillus sp. N3.4]TXK81947.1 endolytic transglycosylase MltG [Paenibacillus sp. N3.4]